MKKRVFLLLFLSFCLINCFEYFVYAENKDVEVKYEVSYNVDLVKVKLDNDSKSVNFDGYDFELSTKENNLEVVIFKTNDDAKSYVEGFSGSKGSYYLAVYRNGEKINSYIKIKLNASSKILNVYRNNGKLVDKSNEKISLTNSDYFLVVTDKIDIDNSSFIIVDDGNEVNKVEDIVVEDDSEVEVYNSNDVKVDSSSVLGTNYKVVVKSKEKTYSYVVVVKGDTTGDARINLNDITRLYHNYKGIEKMDDAYILAGDVAKNDIINLNDVTKLYHYYKKLIPTL